MNKFKINSLVVALALLMPCLAFALPGAHDPSSGRAYTCNSCHTSNSTIGNKDSGVTGYATNVCYRCHATGGQSGNAAIKFQTEDFANPFDTTTVAQSTKIWSSHKWFGPEVVPAAGAVAPVDTVVNGLNKNAYFKGTIFCARCHNVHGTSGVQSLSSPYLRYPNDQDQMCFNCHRPRDTKDHTLGTHPVNVSYTSASVKAKIVAGEFLASPVANAVNLTGQVKLVNSKVVCSTCHRVHNTDSRTSTFDPYSTGQTFGQLSSSNGYLLRVDVRGKTANATNICTNCHAGKTAHNQKNQNVQCNDCHGGHVAYDPSATGGETTPNINLVRRYLQYSTAGRLSKRIVYNSTTTKNFYNTTTGKGVCQSCHNPPASHFTASVYNRSTDCSSCHSHDSASGSFSGATGCTGCHGQPPKLDVVGTDGRDIGYTRYMDESTTPHASHASGGTYYSYSCNDCHSGTAPGHPNASGYTFVLTSPSGTKAGAGASYTANTPPADSTCNNVYCHSNGAGAFKAGQAAIGWNVGKKDSIIGAAAAIRCATCHDVNTALVTGSHAKHVALTAGNMGYGCVTCHAATVSDNTTISNKTNHANAVKDIQFSGTSPTVSGTSCATVYCHSNGKGSYSAPSLADWAAKTNGACGTCHLTASSGTKLATGGHSIHIGATIDTSTCVKCHTYTGETVAPHVNGTFNVNYDASGCATNNCHASIAPPVWTAAYAGKDTCTKCHGTLTNTGVITAAANNRYIVAPSETPGTGTGKVSTTNAKVGAHETHLKYLNGFSNYSTVDYRCESCHGTLPAAGTHATGLSTPAFQNLATKWGAITTASFSAGTCSNTYCHNPAGTTLAAANNGTAPPPSWTNAAYIAEGGKSLTNCELCHKVPGTPSFSKQSAHGSMVTDSSANQCNACHGHNGDATGALGSRHVDGILYASGSCDTCHGYPPMTATDLAARTGGTYVNAKVAVDGGGGYHKTHLLPTIVIADGFTPCLPCHPSDTLGFHMQGGGTVTSANVNVFYAADTGYRFDSTRTKRYDNVAKKCSNISCHFKPISAWNL